MSIHTSTTVKPSLKKAVSVRQTYLDRATVVNGLVDLRRELEEGATTKTKLSQVNVSAGFLLQDVCYALGLTEAETRQVLGKHYVSAS